MKGILPFLAFLLLLLAPGQLRASGEEEKAKPEPYSRLRSRMVDEQIAGRGIADTRVLEALRKVPRHEFVPPESVSSAYDDRPLPIGYGQTISQPYIVAFMTEVLRPGKEARVLELGTGSGYQAAVLAELVKEVYTVEIVEELAEAARKRLDRLGYGAVRTRTGDGYYGWKEEAPFDAIIVTAAAEHVPPSLPEQLKNGGSIVIPIGGMFDVQALVLITKSEDGRTLTRRALLPVRFVPLTGAAMKK